MEVSPIKTSQGGWVGKGEILRFTQNDKKYCTIPYFRSNEGETVPCHYCTGRAHDIPELSLCLL